MKNNHWYAFDIMADGKSVPYMRGTGFASVDDIRKEIKSRFKNKLLMPFRKIVAGRMIDGRYDDATECVLYNNIEEIRQDFEPPVLLHDYWYLFEKSFDGTYLPILSARPFETVDKARDALKDHDPRGKYTMVVARRWYYNAWDCLKDYIMWTSANEFGPFPPPPEIDPTHRDMLETILNTPPADTLVEIRAKVDQCRALLKQVDDIREQLYNDHRVTSNIKENAIGIGRLGVGTFTRYTFNAKVEI